MSIDQLLRNVDFSLVEVIEAYNQILGAMQRQRAALISRDESALEQSTSEIRTLMQCTRKAEDRRDQRCAELATHLSMGEARPTLKEIVALAQREGCNDLATSLSESHDRLVSVLSQVTDIHNGNATIIQRRMVYGRYIMGLLAGVTGYGSDGSHKAARISRISIKA